MSRQGPHVGISRALDGELLVQNRSHYVSAGDHAQYRPLFSTWLADASRVHSLWTMRKALRVT